VPKYLEKFKEEAKEKEL
jgi:hypothetical protein